MQIICKQALLFKDAIMEPATNGELVEKVRSSIIVQPSYRPTTVPDWVKDDATFKNALAVGSIEVIN